MILDAIYEYFDDYSRVAVDKMLLKLNDEEKKLLVLKYGKKTSGFRKNTDMKEEDKRNFEILRRKMKRIIDNPEIEPNSYEFILPDLYQYLNKYEKEKIYRIFVELNEEEKKLLQLKFRKKIDFYFKENCDRQEDVNRVIFKIRYLLGKKNKYSEKKQLSIYEFFSDYKKESVDHVISKLEPEEKKLLYLYYCGDLENPTINYGMTAYEKKQFKYLLMEKIKKMLAQDCFMKQKSSNQTLTNVLQLISSSGNSYLLEDYSTKQVCIILLRAGLLDNTFFSEEEIAEKLNLSEEEVKQTIKYYLESEIEKRYGYVLTMKRK